MLSLARRRVSLGFEVLSLGFEVLSLGFDMLSLGFEVLSTPFAKFAHRSNLGGDIGGRVDVRWTTPYRIELSDEERSVLAERARSSNAPYRQVIGLESFSMLPRGWRARTSRVGLIAPGRL